jgi:hypothetical protein
MFQRLGGKLLVQHCKLPSPANLLFYYFAHHNEQVAIIKKLFILCCLDVGQESSVSTVTKYGLNDWASISGWGMDFFHHCIQTSSWDSHSLLFNGYWGSLPWVKKAKALSSLLTSF